MATIRRIRTQDRTWTLQQKIFFILIIIVLVLTTLNIVKAKGWLIPEQPQLNIVGKVIELDSMTLEQKIAQMLIVHGGPWNLEAFKNMQIGGIHIFALERESLYVQTINQYQTEMQVPLFVTIDFEGCWNPFANFRKSVAASDIHTVGEAYQKGSDDGKYLRQLGFSINFAPVVDLEDQIWKCRSFPGNETEVSELAEAYILGLQNQKIIGTAKHYPGKTLEIKDPHKYLVTAEVTEADLYPFRELEDTVDGIMVSHIIVSGAVDSKGVPSVVSSEVVGGLKTDYPGLVITDEINMLGLRKFYPIVEEMYIAVFKAGNDLIINFNDDPNEIYYMIQVVKEAVEAGEIPLSQIDRSVKKILEVKGFVVE